MPDQPSPAPAAPTAQPMAVPAADQSNLLAAAAGAHSRMDGWEAATPADFGSPQPSGQVGDDFSARLAQAQQSDQARVKRLPQQQPAAPQTPAMAAEPASASHEPVVKWKRSADWNALKSERDSLRAEVDALKNGHAPADPATNGHTPPALDDIWKHPEVAKLKTERDQFYETVKLVNAEQDPEFKARFDSEREAALNVIKRSAGGARDEILEIMAMPPGKARDRALQETIKDFGDSSKAEILAANGRLIQIGVNRQIELETRAKTWDQRQAYQANQQGAQRQQREGEMKSAFQKVAQKWQDPNAGMPFTIPNGKGDTVAQSIRERAEAILFGQNSNYTPELLANDAMKAAAFDQVILSANQVMDHLESENKTLREAYERVTGTQPDGAGSGRFASAAQTSQAAAQPLPPGGRSGTSGYAQILPVLDNIPQWDKSLEEVRRRDQISQYQGR